ncbi:MAG: PUR family DNA/RNA-binding protein [Mediterranea sp.]|jgi:hypothetical protein|nr:PUR family DNA/RNA-binding protein [Mediterranea sp.]
MEEFKRRTHVEKGEKEIVFSQAIKAGKRIYYVDVKKSRNNEMFLSITESKKVVTAAEGDGQQVNFEKHKIFLYQEDFDKFMDGMGQAISYIRQNSECPEGDETLDGCLEEVEIAPLSDEIKIDIDF